MAVKATSYPLGWIPVDVLADSLVRICCDQNAPTGVLHACGIGPTLPQVLEVAESKGYRFHDVTAQEFLEKIHALPDEEFGGFKILAADMDFPPAGQRNVTHEMKRVQRALGLDEDELWPVISNELIELHVARWIETEYFLPVEVQNGIFDNYVP